MKWGRERNPKMTSDGRFWVKKSWGSDYWLVFEASNPPGPPFEPWPMRSFYTIEEAKAAVEESCF